jgi:hypothetical protein
MHLPPKDCGKQEPEDAPGLKMAGVTLVGCAYSSQASALQWLHSCEQIEQFEEANPAAGLLALLSLPAGAAC